MKKQALIFLFIHLLMKQPLFIKDLHVSDTVEKQNRLLPSWVWQACREEIP